ncbi:MAG: hypothetical protein KBO60_07035 [Achromobacter sp.]|nr:hypothetical protein [Achromobacter sp.]
MNNPVQSDSARRGLHPLVSAAAIAVIVMCSVGVAAVLGWLPTPSATPHPEDPALLRLRIGPGTADISEGPAMSRADAAGSIAGGDRPTAV